MPRPVKTRHICEMPKTSSFSPENYREKEILTLTIDEYEAIRLLDYLSFTQHDASKQMNVSRTTVQAIYDNARKKIADALVNGKKIVIKGGNYKICQHTNVCCGKDCGQNILKQENGKNGYCRRRKEDIFK